MRGIDITLDKPRRMRFDINALDRLEQILDLPLVQVLDRFQWGSIRAIKAAVWVALLHEDRNLTLDRVGHLLQAWFDADHQIPELRDLLMEAIWASGIVRKDAEASPDPPPTSPETP